MPTRALHRVELATLSPEQLAEMFVDIMALLVEHDCLGMVQEVQAERRAALMADHDDDGPSAHTTR